MSGLCLIAKEMEQEVTMTSAARFGDLLPFGLLFQPFGDQYFDLATWKYGDYLSYFLKTNVIFVGQKYGSKYSGSEYF